MHIPPPNPTGYSLGQQGIHDSLGGIMSFLKPPDTPPASPTLSSFTFTTSMHTRPFREDDGRLYNAAQEDYSLPADSQEVDRLNIQHLAYKARVGKNYIGPLENILKDTEGKRVVDLGCGTGLWTIEVGKEFPQHEFIGLDLVPIQPTHDQLPENVSFVQDDVTIGLPWPDQTVDVVHARMLFAGIRDYSAIVREAVRVLKPNGLFLVVEGVHFDAGGEGEIGDLVRDSPHLVGRITDGFWKHAPGMAAWLSTSHRAFQARGLDVYAAVTVPEMVRQNPDFGPVSTTFVDLPLSPWSADRTLNKVGRLMYQDAKTFPQLMKLFITDGVKIDRQEYARLCARFSTDLNDLNTKPILYFPASWAIRL